MVTVSLQCAHCTWSCFCAVESHAVRKHGRQDGAHIWHLAATTT